MTRTNAFGLLTIVIRGFALWMALSALFSLATGIATDLAAEWGYGPFLSIYGVMFGVAALLWLFADVLARLTLARPTTPLFESDLQLAEWQRLAFSCIGLWIAVEGMLDVAGHLLRLIITQRMYPDLSIDDGSASAPELAVGVLRFLVGTALLFGARGLVTLLARMRRRDASPASNDT